MRCRAMTRRTSPAPSSSLRMRYKPIPRALAAQALLGRAYLASGQPDAAEEAFEKALKLGVHPSELAVPMAQALLDQGKAKELLGRFTARSVSVSQRPELLLLRGHAYKQSGDLASARQEFEEALTVKPGFVPALRSEAELLIREGRTAEAVKFVGEATRLDSSDSAAWFLKGLTSQAAGDIASAMTEYGRAIELSPRNYEARLARAWLWLEQGRREELETDIEYLSRDGNKDPRFSYLRSNYLKPEATANVRAPRCPEVAETLEPAQPGCPSTACTPTSLDRRARALWLGRPERARDYLQRYVQAEPT